MADHSQQAKPEAVSPKGPLPPSLISMSHGDDPICKTHEVVLSIRKCCQLLMPFLLVFSIRDRFFPTDSFDSISASLRVQTIPHRRLQALPNNAICQFDILVPVFERDANLRDFARRLKPALDDYTRLTARNQTQITEFRLIITRYDQEMQDSNPSNSTQFQQELSQMTGLPLDQVVLVHAPPGTNFSRAHALNLLLSAACQEVHCLVARVDVDLDVKASFFWNSEREVLARQTAYFPIVWSAYHPMAADVAQFSLDVQASLKKQPRDTMEPYSPHRGHWRDYGTGMWTISGPDAKEFRFNQAFKGWGGEDGDFYNRIKERLKIIRARELGLVHLWHPKYCTRGVTVFTDNQMNECVWSRDGEKGSDLAKALVDKWVTQNQPVPVSKKPIWQA